MSDKILFVDDEMNVLDAYRRGLRKEFQIETAAGGEEALALVASRGPFAVIVSDMRMPGMDGARFLSAVKELAPDSVRVMLTGNADQQTAIEAVNEGHIFRFLTKPCPPEALSKTLAACLRQYRLVTAEKELLEKTLRGSIQVFTEVISLVNPTAFGRASRVSRLMRELAEELRVENLWQMEIAAMLSQVGCLTVPEETLLKVYRGVSLTAQELQMLRTHPQTGRDLIAHIPRLEAVAEIIAYQDKFYNGSGLPDDGRRAEQIPLGARILKVALDYDKLIEGKFTHDEAVIEMKRRGDWYDPVVVAALAVRGSGEQTSYRISHLRVGDFCDNMILGQDVVSSTGLLLITEGQEVTLSLRMRLENFLSRGWIEEPIKVLIPAA